MKSSTLLAGLWLVFPLAASSQPKDAYESEADELSDRIVVTAEFRPVGLNDLSGSATVIDAETARQRNAAHLEDVLNLAPNVNFSSGASRGRFFQIRGIGSRSQFVEPANASVGLLVDGIDLTGLGGAASTLDIEQVEILRGPQGTLFGANALAGMINLVSAAPTSAFGGRFEAGLGEFGTRRFQGAASGPLGETLGYRLAYGSERSDGYQNNAFLDRDDLAGIDEQTLRGRLRWDPHQRLTVDFTGLYLDIDNGYDAFSLDNTRTTLSDEPGHDRQETVAGSMRLSWQAADAFGVEALLSRVDADLEYGFDEDWSFVGLCEIFECPFGGYSSFDNYLHDNRNTTLDVRAVSASGPDEFGWVIGAYQRDQTQRLRRVYTFLDEDFLRDYETDNRAVYGRVEVPLAASFKFEAGLRFEQREARYSDSDGARFRPDENLWGGRMALQYRLANGGQAYALISRGYKAGGVNSDSSIPDAQREFATEVLWNYELGFKARFRQGRVDLRAALFFQDREDIQTQQSLVVPISGDICPCRFIEFQTNATAGQSYGLEAELNWQVNDSIQAFGSLGLMDSRFEDFLNFSHVDADPDSGTPFDLDDRDLPHAPNYMFALGAVFQLSDRWYLRTEIEGKDAFFFSSRHEVRSDAYQLFHARLGYRTEQWDLALWARNIGDEDIKTRGFGSFGNDPRDGYIVEPYFQFGQPRVLGVSASYAF
ncbi:MAG: TonB-dependent receptor [Wenzhouxiangella sp.]|jgi:outer membrane receptor protein involved in Fe transport|nr:TonB-dependent receptor [Wenzhouxiangella sp.]